MDLFLFVVLALFCRTAETTATTEDVSTESIVTDVTTEQSAYLNVTLTDDPVKNSSLNHNNITRNIITASHNTSQDVEQQDPTTSGSFVTALTSNGTAHATSIADGISYQSKVRTSTVPMTNLTSVLKNFDKTDTSYVTESVTTGFPANTKANGNDTSEIVSTNKTQNTTNIISTESSHETDSTLSSSMLTTQVNNMAQASIPDSVLTTKVENVTQASIADSVLTTDVTQASINNSASTTQVNNVTQASTDSSMLTTHVNNVTQASTDSSMLTTQVNNVTQLSTDSSMLTTQVNNMTQASTDSSMLTTQVNNVTQASSTSSMLTTQVNNVTRASTDSSMLTTQVNNVTQASSTSSMLTRKVNNVTSTAHSLPTTVNFTSSASPYASSSPSTSSEKSSVGENGTETGFITTVGTKPYESVGTELSRTSNFGTQETITEPTLPASSEISNVSTVGTSPRRTSESITTLGSNETSEAMQTTTEKTSSNTSMNVTVPTKATSLMPSSYNPVSAKNVSANTRSPDSSTRASSSSTTGNENVTEEIQPTTFTTISGNASIKTSTGVESTIGVTNTTVTNTRLSTISESITTAMQSTQTNTRSSTRIQTTLKTGRDNTTGSRSTDVSPSDGASQKTIMSTDSEVVTSTEGSEVSTDKTSAATITTSDYTTTGITSTDISEVPSTVTTFPGGSANVTSDVNTTFTTFSGNISNPTDEIPSTVPTKSTPLPTVGENITVAVNNTVTSGLSSTDESSYTTISGNATTGSPHISGAPSTDITNVTNKITTLSLGNKTVTEGAKVTEVNGSSTSNWTKMHETTLTTIIGNATSTYAGETSTVSATNAKSTILQTEGANITLGLSNTESSLTSQVTISGNATTENGSISETPSTEITNVTNKITTLSLGNKTVTEGIKVTEVNGSSTSSWTKMHETTLSGFTSTGITLSPTVSVNVTETSGISSKGKSSQTTYTVYETTTGSSSTETIDASSTVTKVTILPGSSEKLTDEVTTLSVPSTNKTTRATVITSTDVSSVSTGSTDESRKPTSSPTDEGGMTNSTEASGSSAMHVTNGTTTSSNGNKNITEEISRTSRGVLSTREMTSATGHGITNNTITSSTGLTSPFPVTTDDLTTDEIKATTEDVLSTKPDEVTTEITRKITTTSEKPLNLTTAGNPLQSTEKGSTIDVQTTLIRTSSPSTTIAFEITVKVSNITSHSADIRWTTSMFGYTLVFLIAHDGKILTKVQAKCNELKVNVTRLEPYTRYNIVIRLMDSNHSLRDLKFNGAHDFMTSVYVPSAPTSVRFECLNSTSGLATWNPPKTPNGIIELYNLTLTGIKDGYPDHILRVKTSLCSEEGGSRIGRKRIVCSYNVDNVLRPSYEYRLKVKAKTLSVPKWGPQSVSSPGCVTESAIPPFPKKTLSIVEHHTHRPDVKSQVSFQFPEDVFSSVNGEITSYAVILASKGFMSPPSNGSLTGYNCLESWNDVYLKSGKNREPIFEYQASPPLWCPMKGSFDPLKCILYKSPQTSAHIQCIIGWQRNCTTRKTAKNTYCNGPLRDDTEYSMKLRGFTSSGYADSPLLEFKTDPVPDEDGIDKDSLSAGIIAGIIIPIVTLIACAAVFVSYKRKRFPFSEKAVDAPSMISSNQHDVNMMEMKPKPQESSFDGAVSYKDFALHVRRLLADSALLFSQEYNTLKEMSPQKSVNDAKLEENRRKNRWINILPYDCSRVKLLPIADEAGSDYINASYIPGYHSPREYIATQGPLQNTVDDFWRLVWEQDVSVIVMVTQCVERGKKKCETYWPETREPRHYGDIRITMTSESILSSFCIRVFLLQLGKHDRVVKQLHFTRWPDFGCPEDTGSLLNFVQTVRTHTPHVAGGPILVHCSAGVGRTGTFITVDTWLHHIDDQSKSASTHRRCIDIFNTVFRMRHHRLNMVQTEDQYIYIHECIRDYLQESCQNTNSLEAGSYEIYENLAMVKDDIARV